MCSFSKFLCQFTYFQIFTLLQKLHIFYIFPITHLVPTFGLVWIQLMYRQTLLQASVRVVVFALVCLCLVLIFMLWPAKLRYKILQGLVSVTLARLFQHVTMSDLLVPLTTTTYPCLYLLSALDCKTVWYRDSGYQWF